MGQVRVRNTPFNRSNAPSHCGSKVSCDTLTRSEKPEIGTSEHHLPAFDVKKSQQSDRVRDRLNRKDLMVEVKESVAGGK